MSDQEMGEANELGGTYFKAPVPGPGPEDVFFFRAEPEGAGAGGREFEDIMLRRVPAAVAYRFRGAAGARSLTHAQYLSALVALHEVMRNRADSGDDQATSVLAELGLGTVSI
jgi:hypothetical protein